MDQDAFKCVMAALWFFRRWNSRSATARAAGAMLAAAFVRWEYRRVVLLRLGKDGQVRRWDWAARAA
jgi:hypothetical protein